MAPLSEERERERERERETEREPVACDLLNCTDLLPFGKFNINIRRETEAFSNFFSLASCGLVSVPLFYQRFSKQVSTFVSCVYLSIDR